MQNFRQECVNCSKVSPGPLGARSSVCGWPQYLGNGYETRSSASRANLIAQSVVTRHCNDFLVVSAAKSKSTKTRVSANPCCGITEANIHSERRDIGQKN